MVNWIQICDTWELFSSEKWLWRIKGYLRRLRGESSHNALFGVQERNVIAGTFFGLGGLLLLGGGVQPLNHSSSPWAQFLHKAVPTRKVEQRSPLYGTSGNTVTPKSTPDGNIGSGERVSDDEGTESKVLVETLQVGFERLEVKGSERIQLGQPRVLLQQALDRQLDMVY